MPISIIREDITNMCVDIIVNPTNTHLYGTSGIDGSVHRKSGVELDIECNKIGTCEVGEIVITSSYNLPCKNIIHTVGPKWVDGNHNEDELLISCYSKALDAAAKLNAATIAFPLISSGHYHFPKDKVINIALQSIRQYLNTYNDDLFVYLVIFDDESYKLSLGLEKDIKKYIDEFYINNKEEEIVVRDFDYIPIHKQISLSEIINEKKEEFRELLLKLIDEKGITDSQCYKSANVSKGTFNKIKNNSNYKVGKATVMALGIALELPINEFTNLLNKAGYALSDCNLVDIIVRYFVERNVFDIDLINITLFDNKLPILGQK